MQSKGILRAALLLLVLSALTALMGTAAARTQPASDCQGRGPLRVSAPLESASSTVLLEGEVEPELDARKETPAIVEPSAPPVELAPTEGEVLRAPLRLLAFPSRAPPGC